VGFYYGSNQPPDDDKPAGFRDVIAISWAVFRVLAIPLGLMVAVIVYLGILFWLFTLHWVLGVAWLLVLGAVIAGRGVWEARHPPELF
jgi:hypothetical protein